MKLSKCEIVKSKEINSYGEPIHHFLIDNIIWMSNTDDEVEDCIRALQSAHDNCYIGGLGLGWITIMAAKNPAIKQITVVEINPMVMATSIPFVRSFLLKEEFDKIKFVNGDASKDFFELYDWMYFDTWLEPDDTGRQTMKECFKNAKPYLKRGGVLEAWLKWRLDDNI